VANGPTIFQMLLVFSARCNIYISRLCHDASPSVTEVHCRIIANLGFKFRSHFSAHCSMAAVLPACSKADVLLAARPLAVLLADGSSRAMLASARLSCYKLFNIDLTYMFIVIQCLNVPKII